jgi:hypothetical protein
MTYIEAWDYLVKEMHIYFDGDRDYDKDDEARAAVEAALRRLQDLDSHIQKLEGEQ